jgi:3-dehydroquinate synthase
MEAFLVSDNLMTIKSYKSEYKVEFCDDGIKHLINNLPHKSNFHLIIDENISKIYRDQLSSLIKKSLPLIIEATESNKSLQSLPRYVKHLVNNNIRKNDILIAIGGGIIQDITCFLSATLLRGLDWYFYPTTLLAQADSCIGSKSSINCGDSKNLLGTFTPPSRVIIANNFLKTLQDADLKSGVGEMFKVHCIKSPKSFDNLSESYEELFVDEKLMMKYIHSSLLIKKKYIEIDEFDVGPRNIFNYGHSFGHAIESATDFKIPHGIAVSIGMDMANWISPKIGNGTFQNYLRMHTALAKNYCDFNNIEVPIDTFISAISKDKKNIGINNVSLILPNDAAKIEKIVCKNNKKFHDLCFEYFNEILINE